MSTLFFGPRKILINSIQNYLCFAWPKAPGNPLEGITCLLAAVARLTGRKHVGNDSAGTVRAADGDKVVSGQTGGSEESVLLAAVGTQSIPPIKATSPVISSKIVGEFSLSGFVTPESCTPYFGVRAAINTGIMLKFFAIPKVVGAKVDANFGLTLNFMRFTLFGVGQLPFKSDMRSAGLTARIYPSAPRPKLGYGQDRPAGVNAAIFLTAQAKWAAFISWFHNFDRLVTGISDAVTRLAITSVAITVILPCVELGQRLPVKTKRAFSKGTGDIQHSVSLSPYLKMLSAGGEISRQFGLQSLADRTKYISRQENLLCL